MALSRRLHVAPGKWCTSHYWKKYPLCIHLEYKCDTSLCCSDDAKEY